MVEIDPTLCQTVSSMKPFWFFALLHSKINSLRLPFLKIAQNVKMTMSITAKLILTKFVSKWSLHRVVSKLNKNRRVKMASIPKIRKNGKLKKSQWNLTKFVSQWSLHEAILIVLQFDVPRWLPSSIIANSTKLENDNVQIRAESCWPNLC